MTAPPPPLVTVCVPTYNSEATVERCLRSISSQDYDNVEVLVIDDCSTDDTVTICRKYSDSIHVLTNDHNLGLVGNHNRCIRLARGKYVKFVHADDYLLPGAISLMVSALESFPQAMLAFSRRTVDSTVETFLRDSSELHGPLEPLSECTDGVVLLERFIRDGARRNLFGEPTAIMFNRDAGESVGGFSHELPQLLDVGFCLALLEHGAAAWIDKPLSVRVHTYGTTSESNFAAGVGSLDVLKLQLALTRSPKLSLRYRVIAGRLAAVSFTKALVKAILFGPRRSRLLELTTLAHQYVVGDLQSPGAAAPGIQPGYSRMS
ncbi:glycosyltransferase family 2 protein [Mycolicibacterium sp. ELW1]|uniref:glycosyltransferase family 2 protein n=1 Tax=Mycobacteriaceae TaxID=1762 RepID=UPI00143D3549|nr:glycosyltransferase family 2 protein [Mycobacterium sp. ELW1]